MHDQRSGFRPSTVVQLVLVTTPASHRHRAPSAAIVVHCTETDLARLQPAIDLLRGQDQSVTVQQKSDAASIGRAVEDAGPSAIHALCPGDQLGDAEIRRLRLLIGARGIAPGQILTVQSDWRNPMALVEAIDAIEAVRTSTETLDPPRKRTPSTTVPMARTRTRMGVVPPPASRSAPPPAPPAPRPTSATPPPIAPSAPTSGEVSVPAIGVPVEPPPSPMARTQIALVVPPPRDATPSGPTAFAPEPEQSTLAPSAPAPASYDPEGADLYAEVLDDYDRDAHHPVSASLTPALDEPSPTAADSATTAVQAVVRPSGPRLRRLFTHPAVVGVRPRWLVPVLAPMMVVALVVGAVAVATLAADDGSSVPEPAQVQAAVASSDRAAPAAEVPATADDEVQLLDQDDGVTRAQAIAAALKSQQVGLHADVVFAPPVPTKMSFHDGEVFCRDLDVRGLTDWHIATAGELHVLTDDGPLDKGAYWSATDADLFGSRALVWNAKKVRAAPVARGWSGGLVVCVLDPA